MAPITVDGLDIDDATIDGDVVDEITMDGDVVYQASAIPDSVIDVFEDEPDGLYASGEDIYDYYTVQMQSNSMNRTTQESLIGEYSVYSDDGSGNIDYSPHGDDTLLSYPEVGSIFFVHFYDNAGGRSGPNLGFLLDEGGEGLGIRARRDPHVDLHKWLDGDDNERVESKDGEDLDQWPEEEWVRIRIDIRSETELNVQFWEMDGQDPDDKFIDVTYNHDIDIDYSKHGFGFGSDQSFNTANIYFDWFGVEEGPVYVP